MNRSVLYHNSVSYIGGAEISLLRLIEGLDEAAFRPCLVTGEEGELADRARELGAKVCVQDLPRLNRRRPWMYVSSVLHLARTMRQERISLVHTNGPHGLTHTRWACRLTRNPYVAHVRDFRHAWFRPAVIAALNQAARVISNSHAVTDVFAEAGVQESRIRTIYNPVDLTRFRQGDAEAKHRLRRELGLPLDAFVVGIVGQIQPIKGHEDLIRAAPDVLSAVPDVQFLVVGEAFNADARSFKRRMLHLLAEFGLNGRFHILGFRHDIPAVMNTLDLLVVPSWQEPFGRVVVEGLAAGCAVIGTRAGGIPEIVEHGVTGLLVPPRDSESLASAIIRLAQDDHLRAKLRQAGPRAAGRFAVERHAEQIQALYDSVLEHHPA